MLSKDYMCVVVYVCAYLCIKQKKRDRELVPRGKGP